jgi:hypothetical protein
MAILRRRGRPGRYSLAIMAPRGAAGVPEGGETELLRVTADTLLFRGVQVGEEVLPRGWLSNREAREAPCRQCRCVWRACGTSSPRRTTSSTT